MLSRRLIKEIEAYFHQKTGRVVCYLPSARLGIYSALCEMFPPGAGLVLSPVTDDIVLFAVLAAGLKPIFIDIEPGSGGLRVDRIPAAASAGAAGVLTSNIYGIPDDVSSLRKACDKYGLILIEDCAHAMGCSVDGKSVGTFGEVSVFSLAKHIGGLGGIVTAKNPKWVEAIKKRAEPYIQKRQVISSFFMSARLLGSETFVRFPGIKKVLKMFLSPILRFLPNPYEHKERGIDRKGHRVPIRLSDFADSKERRGLEYYNKYLKVDNFQYRDIPCWYTLHKNVKALRGFDEIANLHRTAKDRVDPVLVDQMGHPQKGSSACYFKIPFFVEDRSCHYDKLTGMGINLDHIYDPPFTFYVPSELYRNCISDNTACVRWSKTVLPVALPDIERVCAYLVHIKKKRSVEQNPFRETASGNPGNG